MVKRSVLDSSSASCPSDGWLEMTGVERTGDVAGKETHEEATVATADLSQGGGPCRVRRGAGYSRRVH